MKQYQIDRLYKAAITSEARQLGLDSLLRGQQENDLNIKLRNRRNFTPDDVKTMEAANKQLNDARERLFRTTADDLKTPTEPTIPTSEGQEEYDKRVLAKQKPGLNITLGETPIEPTTQSTIPNNSEQKKSDKAPGSVGRTELASYKEQHIKDYNTLLDLFVDDSPVIEDQPLYIDYPSFRELKDLKKDQQGFHFNLEGKGNLDSPVGNMEIIPSTDPRSELDKELYGPLPKDSVKLTLGNQKVNIPPGLSFEPGVQRAEVERLAEVERQKDNNAMVAANNADIQKRIVLATAAKAKVNNTSPLLSSFSSLSSVQKALLGLGAAGAGYGLYKYLTKKKKKPVIYQNQLEYNT